MAIRALIINTAVTQLTGDPPLAQEDIPPTSVARLQQVWGTAQVGLTMAMQLLKERTKAVRLGQVKQSGDVATQTAVEAEDQSFDSDWG